MTVSVGTRVAIRQRLLEPRERAPSLPEDTAVLPYEAVITGTLVRPALLGARATIQTASGRLIEGRLDEVEPAYTHGFERPVAALSAVDIAIAELVRSLDE